MAVSSYLRNHWSFFTILNTINYYCGSSGEVRLAIHTSI